METNTITVKVTIEASIEKVWQYFIEPNHIINWYFASDDWHAPFAESNFVVGGIFKTTMAAKDQSFSFDFWGTFTLIDDLKTIEYTLGDNRKVTNQFIQQDNMIELVQTFEPESENSTDMQQLGWQAILNNFKSYTENN